MLSLPEQLHTSILYRNLINPLPFCNSSLANLSGYILIPKAIGQNVLSLVSLKNNSTTILNSFWDEPHPQKLSPFILDALLMINDFDLCFVALANLYLSLCF